MHYPYFVALFAEGIGVAPLKPSNVYCRPNRNVDAGKRSKPHFDNPAGTLSILVSIRACVFCLSLARETVPGENMTRDVLSACNGSILKRIVGQVVSVTKRLRYDTIVLCFVFFLESSLVSLSVFSNFTWRGVWRLTPWLSAQTLWLHLNSGANTLTVDQMHDRRPTASIMTW